MFVWLFGPLSVGVSEDYGVSNRTGTSVVDLGLCEGPQRATFQSCRF